MKKQVFDLYNKVPTGVDTATITPEMDINPEDIKKAVVGKIKSGKTKRKAGFSKRLGITLVAAALGITILGTAGVGAMGGFNQAFGERFAGKQVNGIYPGGDVKVSSNNSVNAELLGIAGDKSNVMSAVQIKSTDTPLTSYDDVENVMVAPSLIPFNCLDENGEIAEQLPISNWHIWFSSDKGDEDYINTTTSLWTQMMLNTDSTARARIDSNGNWVCSDENDYDMRLTDKYTAKIIYFVNRDKYAVTGETMSVKQKEIYMLHKDEMLSENVVDLRALINGDSEEYDRIEEEEKKLIAERKKTLKENQTIIAVSDRESSQNYNSWDKYYLTHTLYVVTIEKKEIDFEGSWKLNYKSEEVKLTAESGLNFDGVQYGIPEIKAGSFKADISISTTENLSSYGLYDDGITNNWLIKFLQNDIEITMKDGEKLKGLWYGGSMTEDEDTIANLSGEHGISFTAEFRYYKYNDYNNLVVWSNLNPNEIDSIKIGDTEIFKAK